MIEKLKKYKEYLVFIQVPEDEINQHIIREYVRLSNFETRNMYG